MGSRPRLISVVRSSGRFIIVRIVWRLLLVLALCPFLMLGTPGIASAATSDLLTIPLNDPFEIPGVGGSQCTIPMAVSPITGGNQIIIGTGGYCRSGPDASPGWCQMFEHPCTKVTVVVKSQTGDSVSADWPAVSSSGTVSMTLTMGSAVIPIAGIDPETICIEMESDQAAFDDSTEGCAATDLDPPQAPAPVPEGCTKGTVTSTPYAAGYPEATIENPAWVGTEQWKLHRGFARSNVSTLITGGEWVNYVIMTGTLNGGIEVGPTGTFKTYKILNTAVAGTPTTADVWPVETDDSLWHPTYAAPDEDPGEITTSRAAMHVVVGMGVMWVSSAAQAAGSPYNIPPVGATHAGRLLGVTDPASCAWYWGTKITSLSSSTQDEPVGILPPIGGTPPIEDPPTVPTADPEPEDPSNPFSWFGALLAKLIDAVRAVFNAVKGVASAILDGLTGAFTGMFVPEDGFFDNRLERLSDAWADTSLSKYSDTMTGMSVPSMTGCTGIPLDVNLGGGVQIHESLGAACTGQMASAAGIVRVVLSAVVVIGGAMACVRAVGSGFGWNPSVGRGDAS